MKKSYELWIDESGAFTNEKELRSKNMRPSLVGGLLIERELVERIPFEEIIDSERNHAMNLTNEDKSNYVLPILERLNKEYHARQVFFENTEYEDENTGRQLYLRIVAEGLLQLMQTLNAQSESVDLHVLIAQRQDVSAPWEKRRILSEEYLSALQKVIKIKRKEHRILLHEDSTMEFQVKVANAEYKLQLADFACNTRLTRDTQAFGEVRNRVNALHNDAYIFMLSEISSVNYIRKSLSNGYISDAIMELYTTKDPINRKKQLELIMKRMKNTSFHLVKSQMEQCVGDITVYAKKEDDYEIAEQVLKRVESELIPLLKRNGEPYKRLQFAILIQLSDLFLQEGDILAAKEVLQRCRIAQEELGNSFEELFSYYQLLEKEALLAIKEFDYRKGAQIMSSVCSSLHSVMKTMQENEHLRIRFPNIKSSLYGDALCAQLNALQFLQRENPGSYSLLCQLSNLMLQQYSDEQGEVEQHRKYRCHVELENGNYEEAVKWLFQAKECKLEQVTEKALIDFLILICDTEAEANGKNYLMYYLLIMCESKVKGNNIADLLYQALKKQKRLLILSEVLPEEQSANIDLHKVDISKIQADSTNILYHPMEIICWKYATYLNLNQNRKEAMEYYNKAVAMCFSKKEYLTMYITGFGIEAERINCLIKLGRQEEAVRSYHQLQNRINEVLELELAVGTKEFVKKIKEQLMLGEKNMKEEIFWNTSRLFTF